MYAESEQPVLTLASASPRRRELLALAGLPFTVAPADLDETQWPGEGPQDYARRLSREKAEAAARRSPGLVLAADTIVVAEGQVLGKPADQAEARATLRALRGRSHTVFTAVTLLDSASGACLPDLACTDVPMRDYTEAEIEAYVASGDPFDKAGGYGIQHAGFHPVDGLLGCYANVMGLPLCHLARNLQRLRVKPARDVPQACQAHLSYTCPVYHDILEGRQ
jgi:septum formation protein